MKRVQTPSTVVVPAERKCPRCGATLGGFGPEGLCGACMFDVAIAEEESAENPNLLASGPRRFGDYELLEEIARGGMGVVFKARQISLNRIVAVKMILRGEFASVADLARFRAEAETAARLQHPNIVAIHEVGEHEGQPFFSMDYVVGQDLAQLVGNTPLPAARAAKYLKTIAEAVQYAHEHGVLHRDLKPSNVLIDTASDQPRVTDFGLAKRLEGDASLTITGQILGSPSYIPPEQAAGKSDAIGPASDVYSLGAVLYHMLTGRPPFVAETIAQTLRLVVETDPVSPRLLNLTMPRDLETICLKCLEKAPERRYTAAHDLADELGRFLACEPVRAQPAGQTEKLWRWCRRKPAGAFSILLVLVISIGSPVAVIWINRARLVAERARQNEAELRKQAEANEQKARTEAAKSQQVAQFLKEMLQGVGPSALGRDTAVLREILDKTAQRVANAMKDQPEVEVELVDTIGFAYWQLAQHGQAEPMLRRSLELMRRLWGNEDPRIAATLHTLGEVLRRRGKLQEAERTEREALAISYKLLGNEHPAVGASLNNLAFVVGGQGRLEEAEALFREALAVNRKAVGPGHPQLGICLSRFGTVLENQGKLAEAEQNYRDAISIQRNLLNQESLGPDAHVEIGWTLCYLARVLDAQGRTAEAEVTLVEGLAFLRKVVRPDHPDMLSLSRCLINFHVRHAKWQAAESALSEVLTLSPENSLTWHKLAAVLVQSGKPERYREHCRKSLERFGNTTNVVTAERIANDCLILPGSGADFGIVARMLNTVASGPANPFVERYHFLKALSDYRHGDFTNAAIQAQTAMRDVQPRFAHEVAACAILAMSRHHSNQPDEARTALAKATEVAQPEPKFEDREGEWAEWMLANALLSEASALICHESDQGSRSPNCMNNLALILHAQGKLDEAEAAVVEALALGRKLPGDKHPSVAESLHILGGLRQKQGKLEEAEKLHREALDLGRRLYGSVHKEIAISLSNLASVLEAQSKYSEAAELYREALAIETKALGEDHAASVDTRKRLTLCLFREGRIAEAKALFNEVVVSARRRGGTRNASSGLVEIVGNILGALSKQHRIGEAEQVLQEALSLDLRGTKEGRDLSYLRAGWLARRGRWKEAADDFAAVLDPSNHLTYHTLGPLLVASGDVDGYREHCAKVLSRFRGTRSWVVAERMAKLCLMLPSAEVDPVVNEWAETAVTLGKDVPELPYCQFVKGLAEYRQGHFANVAGWVRASLAGAQKLGHAYPQVEAHMVLAMTCYKLKDLDGARAALAEGTEIARTKFPKLEDGDLGGAWLDWIIAQALTREAKALIEGAEPSGTKISNSTR